MFTYKKHIATGRYRSFESERHDIKLKKKVVGHIYENGHFDKWQGFKVHLAVKKEPTKEQPAPFKWVVVKQIFVSADEAKAWLAQNYERVIKELDLHQFED